MLHSYMDANTFIQSWSVLDVMQAAAHSHMITTNKGPNEFCNNNKEENIFTVILFDLLEKLPNAEVQFLQNWLQPQSDIMRWNQRPQEDAQHFRNKRQLIHVHRKAFNVSATKIRHDSHQQTQQIRFFQLLKCSFDVYSPRLYEITIPGM